MEPLRILATAGLAIVLYQSIGWGIDIAIAAQSPPKDNPTLPGGSRR